MSTVLMIYWPLFFVTAIVFVIIWIKKPGTKMLLALGFGLLLLVTLGRRLFFSLLLPHSESAFDYVPLVMAGFSVGDLAAYGLMLVGFSLPDRRKKRAG